MFPSLWHKVRFSGLLAAGVFGLASPSSGGAAEIIALQNLYNGRYLDAGRESVELKSEVIGERCKWEKVKLAGSDVIALRNMKNRKYLAMVRRVSNQGGDVFELLLKDRIEDGVVVKGADGRFSMAFDCTKWEIRPRMTKDGMELPGQFALKNVGANEELTIEGIFLQLPRRADQQLSKADRDAASSWTAIVDVPPPPPAPATP